MAFVKRWLYGSAKMFIEYQNGINSWGKLKQVLQDEFGEEVDSFKVHAELRERTKKPNESYQEYTYSMLKIAAQASVETTAIIKYIVRGIPDSAANKACLYGATTIKELKQRFQQYQNIKSEAQSKGDKHSNSEVSAKNSVVAKQSVKQLRCFNCGEKDHARAVCPVKDKGAECFK